MLDGRSRRSVQHQGRRVIVDVPFDVRKAHDVKTFNEKIATCAHVLGLNKIRNLMKSCRGMSRKERTKVKMSIIKMGETCFANESTHPGHRRRFKGGGGVG